jgi:hypothetical protein
MTVTEQAATTLSEFRLKPVEVVIGTLVQTRAETPVELWAGNVGVRN